MCDGICICILYFVRRGEVGGRGIGIVRGTRTCTTALVVVGFHNDNMLHVHHAEVPERKCWYNGMIPIFKGGLWGEVILHGYYGEKVSSKFLVVFFPVGFLIKSSCQHLCPLNDQSAVLPFLHISPSLTSEWDSYISINTCRFFLSRFDAHIHLTHSHISPSCQQIYTLNRSEHIL